MAKRLPDKHAERGQEKARPGLDPGSERFSGSTARQIKVPDFHLWSEVAATVRPLKRSRRRPAQQTPEDASAAPPPRPRKSVVSIQMPSYRSDGRPSRGPGHGIEPGMKKRLQRGTLEIDGTIDLHGMRQAEAHAALTRFIHRSVARGHRTILVITGKGLKKLGPDAAVIIEAGVLRSMLPIWLSEPSLAPVVAGWDIAAQAHGGDGAFYVRLRRAASLVR
jgi:DNA-nicking Smr family endonuclease